MRLQIKILLLILFLTLSGICFGQTTSMNEAIISGTVTDKAGKPLELVNLQIAGTSIGDVSDEKGHFLIQIQKTGNFTLVASLVGFNDGKISIDIKPNKRIRLSITLKETLAELGEIEVTASLFRTGEAKGVTLKPLEVVTTPGAQADLFRAIKTFPGVNTVDQGAGLFVRGGDVSETKILLDQTTVVHPYRFESPTGGARGTIPPFLVSGTYFSTGGFPARYGNALSAVLALQSQDMPQATSVNLNLGMAAASAGFSAPIIDDKLGIRFSGNRSFTKFLFEVNGQASEFKKAPVGMDSNLSLIYKPSSSTTLKFFNYVNRSEIGVRTQEPSFEGLFNSDETNMLHNLQWKQFMDNWLIKTSFSTNRFDSQQQLGGFNLNQEDNTYKVRSDFESLFSGNLQLRAGAEWEYAKNRFIGSVPDQEDVLEPNAAFSQLHEQFGAGRLGIYGEFKFRLNRNISANIGLRSDLHSKTNQVVFDPRLSILYQFNKFTHLHAAAGVYHQFPEPFQFNKETGNLDLGAQQARHYILGLEHEKNLWHLRIEGYYKDYNNLVIDDNATNLSNRGYGYAWGTDIFVKYSEYLKTRFNGWVSYSFLQSNRFQPQDLGNLFSFQNAPSDFDITHNLNVVGKVRLVDTFYLGIGYRFATGRPFTPITDARFIEDTEFYQPIEGPVNSQRLPNFQRLDVDISYYWPFAPGKAATFYVSVSNAFNHTNITNYTYNKDYSQRSAVFSNYSRAVYAGVSLNLGL